MERKYVLYEDFGAVGDGVADDFLPIKAAHDYANDNGLPVKATAGKTYRIFDTFIGGEAKWVSVRTDTDWTGANFIIDDTNLPHNDKRHALHIFVIENDVPDFEITDKDFLDSLGEVGPGTYRLDLSLGYPAVITIFNENKKVFRRGGNGSGQYGQAQREVLALDKDGYVLAFDSDRNLVRSSEKTSEVWMFDYEEITKIRVQRMDFPRVTVKGGRFTTRSCRECYVNTYYFRGIEIRRPFTTVSGVEHYIVGEITYKEESNPEFTKKGPAYIGFFSANATCGAVFENCVLSGVSKYADRMGTYDFGSNGTFGIRLIGCVQCNFWLTFDEEGRIIPATKWSFDENGVPTAEPATPDAIFSMQTKPGQTFCNARTCWGIGGTNFSKYMEYINCVLSRYDAHCGLLNGKISGCTINAVSIVGRGEFVLENTKCYAPGEGESLISLRGDYGSPWDGEIKVKNVEAVVYKSDFSVMGAAYREIDLGFVCHYPNLDVKKLRVWKVIDKDVMDFSEGNLEKYDAPVLVWGMSNIFNREKRYYDTIHLDVLAYGEKNPNKVIPPQRIRLSSPDVEFNYQNFFGMDLFKGLTIEIDVSGDGKYKTVKQGEK